MGVQQQNTPVNKPKTTKPMSEARKIRKPLMERKRRERINTCLNDLASLLMDAKMVKTEPGKAAKLEKADILELTVKHIKNLKNQEKTTSTSETEEDKPISSYKLGFTKCMGMVDQTLGKAGKEALRQRLLAHLKVCLQSLDPPSKEEAEESSSVTPTSVKEEKDKLSTTNVDISSEEPISRGNADSKVEESQTAETATKEITRLTLVPTRLPSGGVAFVIQGGIDPNLLLPQKECKDDSSAVPDTVSPPPSPITCDSSTSSQPITPPTPTRASSPSANDSDTFSAGSTTTVVSSQCPSASSSPPPTDNQIYKSASGTRQSPVPSNNSQHYSQTIESHTSATYATLSTHHEIQCPTSVPFKTPVYSSANPLPTYCPPSSSSHSLPTSGHSSQAYAPASYCIPDKPTQPLTIPHHPAIPHQSYNPPTPPPSISPQNIQHPHQYQYYHAASSEEDMDTDGLSEEEVDIDVENDAPYDLSMRRIWRFW